MTPQLITIVQSDYGMQWDFTLTDAQGVVVDLSGATLKFRAELISDPTVNFENNMAIDTAASGTCHYIVQQTDFVVAGTYNAQIVVEHTGVEIFSFSGLQIVVEPSIPTT